MTKTANKKNRRVKILVTILIILTIVPFTTYLISYQPKPSSQLAYQDANQFDQHYGFIQESSNVGVIIYPGGLVHPNAYARMAKALSLATQYSVFVTSPWFHLAITQINLADQVKRQHSDIDTWFIGGHSLGGTAAAFYTIEDIHSISGLFFLASYTTEQANFSSTNLPVMSIIGSEDLVLNDSMYVSNQRYLPANYDEVLIEGGNHGQFGDYGHQRGDGVALIDGIQQETMVVNALTDWFGELILEENQ
jgi:hypothetical protein